MLQRHTNYMTKDEYIRPTLTIAFLMKWETYKVVWSLHHLISVLSVASGQQCHSQPQSARQK